MAWWQWLCGGSGDSSVLVNLKGIRENFGVLIYDHQLTICVSTPIESMIPEQELSPSLGIFQKQSIAIC
jgi:hypothetical protein